MSTPINTGGPAFPVMYCSEGMTLRDYFAGQALAGISPCIDAEVDKLNSNGKYFDQTASAWYQCAAIRAYCYADAMLASRERKEDAP